MATAVTPKQERVPGNTHFKPTRLVGALANGVNVLQNVTVRERIHVAGATSVLVAARNEGTHQGTFTVDLHRMAANATADDTDGADRLTTGLPTSITFTATGQDREIEMALKGEEYIEVEGVMSNTASDETTITFFDVYLQR